MGHGSQLDAHASAYTAAFPHYEENRITHATYGDMVARHIRTMGARTALSLGIGHAEVARRMLETLSSGHLERYVIVEGSARIIDEFRSGQDVLPEGLELLEGYFETFAHPLRFDVIEAGFVLEHVEDPALVLRRMRDFLAPKGRLIIAVPNARSLHRLLGHYAGLLPDMYALSQADLALGHRRYFDLERLGTLLSETGFQVEHSAGLLLKPFTTGQLHSLNLPAGVWDALMRVASPYPEIAHAIYLEASAAP